MEELDLQKLESIPVPEGLEARLAAKIDEWASEEAQKSTISSDKPALLKVFASKSSRETVIQKSTVSSDKHAFSRILKPLKGVKLQKSVISSRKTAFFAAASIALLFTLGHVIIRNSESEEDVPAGRIDTYTDPRLAYEETKRALMLLASNINRCQQEVKKIDEITQKTHKTIYKCLNTIEE